jgi:hypothetical protein
MRDLRGALRIEHRPKHVRDMPKRNQLVRRRNHPLHRVEIDAVVRHQRQNVDRHAEPLRDHLPRHDVGVVLQQRQQYAVAGLQLLAHPALRDEVDAFGGTADEHDLVWRARADEPRDRFPRCLIGDRHVG